MSTELTTVSATAKVGELNATLAFFRDLGNCGLLPESVRKAGSKNEAAATALIIAAEGRRYGFGPLESLQRFHVVKGRVTPSSDTRAGILLSSPLCIYLRCKPLDDMCTYWTRRADDPEFEHMVVYTKADAQKAGLWGSGTWAKHPKAMLRARCVSIISRQVYPDLFAGVYDEDEINNFDTPAPRANRQQPTRQHQQHEAPKVDDVVDAEFTESEPEPKATVEPKAEQKKAHAPKPQLSELGFSSACADFGLDRNMVIAWREEAALASPQEAKRKKATEWNDYRRGGTIAKLKNAGSKLGAAAAIEPCGDAAWALFDALTDGAAGGAANAKGMEPGVEAHKILAGDWLKSLSGWSE